MAMEHGLFLDRRSFDRSVKQFARDYGFNVRDVMVDQFRLWIQDVVRLFPPRSKAQGRKAVRRDLSRTFFVMDDWQSLEFFTDAFGHQYPDMFNPHAEAAMEVMSDAHERKRGRRGTVPQNNSRVTLMGRSWPRKLAVKPSDFSKYLRLVANRIGILKAGWNRAARAFGAKVPAWVSKHHVNDGTTSGVTGMKKNGDGTLRAGNAVSYSRRFAGLLKLSTDRRERDVTKHLEKRIDKLAARFNQKR